MPMTSLSLLLAFSLILYLCSLLVVLFFHGLDPSATFCWALSWICDFFLILYLCSLLVVLFFSWS